jgi:DNA-binding CsgD family transcriptional regulator
MSSLAVRALTRMLGTDLERAFDSQLAMLGQDMPRPEPNFVFHPPRKWAFDRAWPDHHVAVELEGGSHGPEVHCQNCGSTVRAVKHDGSIGRAIHLGSAHGRDRLTSDGEKYNAASLDGWLLLRFFHDDVYGNPFLMVDTIRHALATRTPAQTMIEPLSDREMEILLLVAAGYPGIEIARRLILRHNTVKRHTANLCMKLNTRNKASAVARAAAWRILDFRLIPWAEEVDLMDMGTDE